MTLPQPPINPYQSPLAEPDEILSIAADGKLLEQKYRSERRTLAWSWLALGGLIFLVAVVLPPANPLGWVAKCLYGAMGAGWLVCGVGGFFCTSPWVPGGLRIGYALIATTLLIGIVMMFDISPQVQAGGMVMQVANLLPLVMLRQAHRVVHWSRLFAQIA
jgi:hypothetical protein